MVGDLATAEDVVQDCFERLHRRWHVIREPSRALAYARSSVVNACRSVHRRSAVSRRYGPWFIHGAVARIVELDADTGHLERTLYTASAAGQSDNLDQSCNVLSLGPGGRHPLVDCFSKLGALVDGQIVSLPGFPSASSSGISDQQAIAW